MTPQGQVFEKKQSYFKVFDPIEGEKYIIRVEYVKNSKDHGDINRFKYNPKHRDPFLLAHERQSHIQSRHNALQISEAGDTELDTNQVYVDQEGNQYICQNTEDYIDCRNAMHEHPV